MMRDVTPAQMPKLDLQALVIDLDGVLYRGSLPIEGSADAIRDIRTKGIRTIFATNNATKTVDHYVDHLATFGVSASRAELVTSAVVAAEKIAERGWTVKPTFLVGGAGIRGALLELGMQLVEGERARHAELVVLSGTSRFDYEDLKTAAMAVRRGAAFIATNDDATFPAPDGLWPGAGALVAAVQVASGRSPEVMGKPHLPMMESVARRLDSATAIGMVGDQPATDLQGAHAMGWTTILVLSGVTDVDAVASAEPTPDVVVQDLRALNALL
jgi:4-nitrophenyl phosphatase